VVILDQWPVLLLISVELRDISTVTLLFIKTSIVTYENVFSHPRYPAFSHLTFNHSTLHTTELQAGRLRVRFPRGSLGFFIHWILPTALWPWDRLSLYQNWVSEMFPGSKSGRCVGLTNLPPSCADCLQIWKPQPPGHLRACPGL
jgi:hypothetical protein